MSSLCLNYLFKELHHKVLSEVLGFRTSAYEFLGNAFQPITGKHIQTQSETRFLALFELLDPAVPEAEANIILDSCVLLGFMSQ